MQISRFTQEGLKQFSGILNSARASVENTRPALVGERFFNEVETLVEDEKFIISIEKTEDITNDIVFNSRYDIGDYLSRKLPEAISTIDGSNIHMWSWLSAYYLKQLCNKNKNGRYELWSTYRYIPESQLKTRYYRHLLFISVWIHRILGDDAARFLLSTELYKHSEAMEQLFTREKDFITNQNLIQASLMMYYDEKKRRLKSKATGRSTRGSAYRLATVIAPQLSMNYDLHSMEPFQILNLLPPEFDDWKKGLTGTESVAA